MGDNLEVVMSYRLKDADYLKLWLHFQNRADDVKEAMFKTLTWLVGYAAALLGFIFFNLTNYEAAKARVDLSLVVALASAAGLAVCLYSWFALSEAGKHIERNWENAERCRAKVEGLEKIIHPVADKRRWRVRIWDQLRIIVALFTIAFGGILVWKP
jgi:hypothetical protein